MLTTIVIFILLLALLVLVHEWGHFIAARARGVEVEEFGFGFPPRLAGFRRGKTLYSLNLIPLGGFVRLRGESGGNDSDPTSFASKKPWERSLILAAGVLMNFACAFILFSFGFMVGLPQQIDDTAAQNLSIKDKKVIIAEVEEGSPAAVAGLTAGDVLLSLNDLPIVSIQEAYDYIASHQNENIALTTKGEPNPRTLHIQPQIYAGHEKPLLGIAMVQTGIVRMNPFEAILQGARATRIMILTVVFALGTLLYNLLTGSGIGNQLSGPIGVAVVTGQVAKLGIPYLISFAAMLSVNLGVLNAIPIPALDGGRLAFVIIEKLRGIPLNEKIEATFHKIGFGLLLLLIIVVTFKDIARYGKSMLEGLTRILW